MSRQFWIGAAAVLWLAAPAEAADLLQPTRAAEQRPALSAPAASLAPSWSGPYAGLHLGAAAAEWDRGIGFGALDCTPCRSGATHAARFPGPNRDDTEFMGGVQAGYNWHLGGLVYGLEADWSLAGPHDRTGHRISSAALAGAGLGALTAPFDGFFGSVSSEVDWLATARGRIGVAAGNVLLYATGGLALADARTRVGYFALLSGSPDPLPVLARDEAVRVGWTVGAGLEAALQGNLSAKVEYLYADFGRDRQVLGTYLDLPGSLLQVATLDEELTVHTVKFGLNYRFSGR